MGRDTRARHSPPLSRASCRDYMQGAAILMAGYDTPVGVSGAVVHAYGPPHLLHADPLQYPAQGVVQRTNAEFDPYHLASLTANTLAGSALRVGEPAYLGWSNVSFTLAPKVVQRSGKDPRILKDLSGSASPGEVVALMGASGCGKTSLMNVLSGRATSMGGHVVTANISINGQTVKPDELAQGGVRHAGGLAHGDSNAPRG